MSLGLTSALWTRNVANSDFASNIKKNPVVKADGKNIHHIWYHNNDEAINDCQDSRLSIKEINVRLQSCFCLSDIRSLSSQLRFGDICQLLSRLILHCGHQLVANFVCLNFSAEYGALSGFMGAVRTTGKNKVEGHKTKRVS